MKYKTIGGFLIVAFVVMVGSGVLRTAKDEAEPVSTGEADVALEISSEEQILFSTAGGGGETDIAIDANSLHGAPTEAADDKRTVTKPDPLFDFDGGSDYLTVDADSGFIELSDFYLGGDIALLANDEFQAAKGRGAAPTGGDDDLRKQDGEGAKEPVDGPAVLDEFPTATELLDFSDPDQEEFCGNLSCMVDPSEDIDLDTLVAVDLRPMKRAAPKQARSGNGNVESVRFEANSEVVDRLIGFLTWFKATISNPFVVILLVCVLVGSSLLGGRAGRREGI